MRHKPDYIFFLFSAFFIVLISCETKEVSVRKTDLLHLKTDNVLKEQKKQNETNVLTVNFHFVNKHELKEYLLRPVPYSMNSGTEESQPRRLPYIYIFKVSISNKSRCHARIFTSNVYLTYKEALPFFFKSPGHSVSAKKTIIKTNKLYTFEKFKKRFSGEDYVSEMYYPLFYRYSSGKREKVFSSLTIPPERSVFFFQVFDPFKENVPGFSLYMKNIKFFQKQVPENSDRLKTQDKCIEYQNYVFHFTNYFIRKEVP